MGYPFPSNYGQYCVLVPIDVALVPHIAGELERATYRGYWDTDEDYELGYNALAKVLADMTNNCLYELVESNNRIYRLLDNALNGTQYSFTPAEDPPPAPAPDPTRPVITPAIGTVPPSWPTAVAAPGLRARVERLLALLDNFSNGRTYANDTQNPAEPALNNDVSMRQQLILAQGILNPGWFGIGGRNATIADIVSALRIGSQADEQNVLETLTDILDAGGDATNIFDAVRGLLSDTVELGTEGGVLAVLIASSIASAAISGDLAGKLNRIIRALDGGGLIGPDDNVLRAIRGDLEASDERNIIGAVDQLRGAVPLEGGAALIPTLADLLGQLAQTSARLQEVVQALRGTTAPEDNVLQALRGATPASATRNVIDGLGGGGLKEEIDQVEELLEGISGQLQ